MRVLTRANVGTIAPYEFQVWKEETGHSTETEGAEVIRLLRAEKNAGPPSYFLSRLAPLREAIIQRCIMLEHVLMLSVLQNQMILVKLISRHKHKPSRLQVFSA